MGVVLALVVGGGVVGIALLWSPPPIAATPAAPTPTGATPSPPINLGAISNRRLLSAAMRDDVVAAPGSSPEAMRRESVSDGGSDGAERRMRSDARVQPEASVTSHD